MRRASKILNLFASYRGNRDAVAAVEFAITAPLFGLFIVGIASTALSINQHSKAREAIRAGAHAVMNGQENLTSIQRIVVYALEDESDTIAVNVSRSARCNGVEAIANICVGGSAPQEYITIDLNTTQEAVLQGSSDIQESIEVRIK